MWKVLAVFAAVSIVYFCVTLALLIIATLALDVPMFRFLTEVWLQPGTLLADVDIRMDGFGRPLMISSVFWGAVASVFYLVRHMLRQRKGSPAGK